MDLITLDSMRYECTIGATDEERLFPQMVEVDLDVEVDLAAACASDSLADTIDYGLLVQLTERTVEGSTYSLLEGLAGALAAGVLSTAPAVDAVTVRVRKLAVPLDVSMEHAQVQIRRMRQAG